MKRIAVVTVGCCLVSAVLGFATPTVGATDARRMDATAASRGALVLLESRQQMGLADRVRRSTGVSVRAAVRSACRSLEHDLGCRLVQRSRHRVARGVAEYRYVLRVGPGRHDRIGLHRVVHEARPGIPASTRSAVMLVHGDVWGFGPLFGGDLGGPVRAPNVATFLARRHVDVWGVDLRWARVPSHTDTFSFMRSWGPAVDVHDVRVATTVERAIREETESGAGRTALLGYSSGGLIAYAYANYETHLPWRSRNVDALVPADTLLRYAPEDDAFRRNQCRTYRESQQALTEGNYEQNLTAIVRLGQSALADPSGPSQVIPGFTNRQAALLVGAQTPQFFNRWFHFAAGLFDADGVPTGLRYTPPPRLFGLFQKASPWNPVRELARRSKIWCGKPDALVDNVDAVRVPVLYLAAAGGFGETGRYSTTLLGSRDVTLRVVGLRSAPQHAMDIGHVDMWQAGKAPRLVWRPLARWLRTH